MLRATIRRMETYNKRGPKPHNPKSTDFSRRLTEEMTRLNVSQSTIASRLGISPGTVSGWFTLGRSPQPRTLKELGIMFGLNPRWLLYGEEPRLNEESLRNGEQVVRLLPIPNANKMAEPVAQYSTSEDSNAILIEEIETVYVPVLSYAQAGAAVNFDAIPESWEVEERIPMELPKNTKACAVKIRGDSMEPKYPEGATAVFLPDIPCRHGDLVIANVKDEGCMFKILEVLRGEFTELQLKSINPNYPPKKVKRDDLLWMWPVDSVNIKSRKR